MPECQTPLTLSDIKKVRDTVNITVPCGKCPACCTRRASAWSFRLMQEEKRSTSAHFITLTYDNTHVPITNKHFLSLQKRDVQLFFKRLRKRNTTQIKYFTVGEYGGKTSRPHYHAIIFNANIQTIDISWQLGEIHYGTLSPASVGYTLKYISKSAPPVPSHKNDDRNPPFSLISKGLGENYCTPAIINWHNAKNERMYVTTDQQQKVSMPRYYKNRIYSEHKLKAVGWLARQNMIKKQALEKPITEQDKAQNIIQAFELKNINAQKGQFI